MNSEIDYTDQPKLKAQHRAENDFQKALKEHGETLREASRYLKKAEGALQFTGSTKIANNLNKIVRDLNQSYDELSQADSIVLSTKMAAQQESTANMMSGFLMKAAEKD